MGCEYLISKFIAQLNTKLKETKYTSAQIGLSTAFNPLYFDLRKVGNHVYWNAILSVSTYVKNYKYSLGTMHSSLVPKIAKVVGASASDGNFNWGYQITVVVQETGNIIIDIPCDGINTILINGDYFVD